MDALERLLAVIREQEGSVLEVDQDILESLAEKPRTAPELIEWLGRDQQQVYRALHRMWGQRKIRSTAALTGVRKTKTKIWELNPHYDGGSS